jgi:hypothetical protein
MRSDTPALYLKKVDAARGDHEQRMIVARKMLADKRESVRKQEREALAKFELLRKHSERLERNDIEEALAWRRESAEKIRSKVLRKCPSIIMSAILSPPLGLGS